MLLLPIRSISPGAPLCLGLSACQKKVAENQENSFCCAPCEMLALFIYFHCANYYKAKNKLSDNRELQEESRPKNRDGELYFREHCSFYYQYLSDLINLFGSF
jgi:hypothetical protein